MTTQPMAMPTSPPESLVDADPRKLGPFEIGPIAVGTWRLTDPDHQAGSSLMAKGVELGFNLVDTADVYGLDWGGAGFGSCEENVGRAVSSVSGLRDQIVLATKGGIIPGVPYNSGATYLKQAVDASLRRLNTDRIDLYQIHRPDMLTSPAAVAESMIDLKEQGKVLEFGVSNFTPAQFDALQHHLPFPLLSTQPQLSAAHLDPLFDGTLDQAMKLGTVPLAWSPLGGGAIVGADANSELTSVLDELAEREGQTRATVALAFVLSLPSRPVAILGTTKEDRLVEAAAVALVNLDRADCYRIIEASTGEKLP